MWYNQPSITPFKLFNKMQNQSHDPTSDSELILMTLADDMAQAATVFQGQGYETFIKARDTFKECLHEIIVGRPNT